MGKADISGKKIINIYNQAWAEWVLQAQAIEVLDELSGDLQFVARATDSLLKVQGQDGNFLALTELQLVYDETMPKRLASYKLLAQQKYNLEVFVTVVYFLPPPEKVKVASCYHQEFMGQTTHIDFQIIKLWELDATAILAFGNPALLPFVPLMEGGNTKAMVWACAERIRQEPDALELETILSVFASYVIDKKFIRQLLRWEMDIVKESPIIQELLDQEFEKGIEQGIEQGVYKATLQALHQTLTIRFKVTLGQFDAHFATLDLEALQKLNEIALTVQSLLEFEDRLADF